MRQDGMRDLTMQMHKTEGGTIPLQLRQAVVTAVTGNTLTVTLDGTSITDVRKLAAYSPTVNDTVWLFQNGGDLLAIDRTGVAAFAALEHDADHADAYAALAHGHTISTAHQPDDRNLILPWNSEWVNWSKRGGTVTESYGGSFTGFSGLLPADLVDPTRAGNDARTFVPDPAGYILYSFSGVSFQAWSNYNDRRPWLRVRAGQAPSRILLQAQDPNDGLWKQVHDDTAPVYDRGTWLGPSIHYSAWPNSNPSTVTAMRLYMEFATTERIYLNAIGLAHPSIPLGWNSFLGDPFGWRNAAYQNGWTTYGSPYSHARYRKDGSGVVHLDGLVKNGTMPGTIFTLPVGYRPAYRRIYNVQSNSASARCDVNTDGAVIAASGSNVWYSIAGITFPAEA